MLIVCAGPDTYRAREKARELERVFREKYDSAGHAVERVGIEKKEHVRDRLYPLLAAGSLFSARRFIRADGCLSILKPAERKICIKRLSETGEGTDVVTVEQEPLPKSLASAPGVVTHAFPELNGVGFTTWCIEKGRGMGLEDKISREVASSANGDAWRAMTELEMQAASPNADRAAYENGYEGSLFEISDAYLTNSPHWRKSVAKVKDESLFTTILSQMRSHARIQGGHVSGIHPYVQKKLSKMRIEHYKKKYTDILRIYVLRRRGFMNEGEEDSIL